MRERGDVPGSAADGDWSGSVQDHEGRRVAGYRLRAVPRQVRQGDKDDRPADP